MKIGMRRLRRRSLHQETFISLSLLVTLFSIVFSGIIAFQTQDQLATERRAEYERRFLESARILTDVFSGAESIHVAIATQPDIQTYFNTPRIRSDFETFVWRNRLATILSSATASYRGIDSVELHGIDSVSYHFSATDGLRTADLVSDLDGGRNAWTVHSDSIAGTQYVFNGSIRNVATSNEVARVQITIDAEMIEEILEALSAQGGFSSAVQVSARSSDGTTTRVAHAAADSVSLDEPLFSETIYHHPTMHVVLVAQIERRDRPDTFVPTVVTAVVTLAVVLAGGLLASVAITRRITRPIEALRTAMSGVGEGDLGVRVAITNAPPEILELATHFNEMVGRVETLVEENKAAEREKRELEIASLERSTHAHFLMNTLETLRSLVSLQEVDTANTLLERLSEFFSASMKNRSPVVSVADEINLVRRYLEIVAIRNPQAFTYEIDVRGPIHEVFLPRLAVQELVENSIQHGLRPCDWVGRIGIVGMEGDYGMYSLRVTDNGIGFDETIGGNERGFGIASIRQRLSLQFGQSAQISVSSAQEHPTVIELVIPRSVP